MEQTSENTPLLTIEDLRISFHNESRNTDVIKGIDIRIDKGQIIGLVGESGSGKSVTGLSLLGLLPSQQTSITGTTRFFDGTEYISLNNLSEKGFLDIRGSKIAMIFQEPMSSLNPVFTCGFQVDEMTRLHLKYTPEAAKKETLRLFEQVGLPDPERIYNSYPHQVSGGQIQRVMIAMAISCKPSLLIADEPTTALDVTVQKKILDLLLEIRDQYGISILFISHDLGVIKYIADHIYVMYKGIICENGPVRSVLNNPQHLYTQGLLACRPPLDHKPNRLPVVSDYVDIKPAENGYSFIPVTSPASATHSSQEEISKTSTDILCEVNNLVVRYPKKKNFWGNTTEWLYAVDDISFKIHKGEVLGIVGESGCGKSTLGRTLVHLEKAYRGAVYFRGEEMLSKYGMHRKKFAREIQIIFQDPYSSLNPKMRIGDAIMEPLLVHGLCGNSAGRKKRMEELLHQVGMSPEIALRYPHEFSGGQRQRISIARALALEPQLLICDESVAALDVSVQAQVLNLLKDLKNKLGLSLLFITHDMSVVNFIADRIIVLNKGKIEEQGIPEEVIQHPKALYTRTLIDSIPQRIERKFSSGA